uniref:Phospholipase A2 n=1 Tax=Panagrellus redivivus TaxID=6233 RepID=A0A7E4US26_PANRE
MNFHVLLTDHVVRYRPAPSMKALPWLSAVLLCVLGRFILINARLVKHRVPLRLGAEPNLGRWYCGGTYLDGIVAIASVYLFCGNIDDINLCCKQHDECYSSQYVSRDMCDGKFYQCLETPMRNCEITLINFSNAVDYFGGYFYNKKTRERMVEYMLVNIEHGDEVTLKPPIYYDNTYID